MSVLAVIPARGGSKGIPRKNVLEIGGVPLIGRTVLAAKACPAIDDVVVSTDDAEIAAAARRFGAHVVDRPAELASDLASSESAIQHACRSWQAASGKTYDLVLLPQNTSPFHDPRDMASVIELAGGGLYRSCISVVETYKYFWFRGESGWRMPHQKRANRQQRGPWHQEAGSLYCTRYGSFCRDGNLFAEPVGTFTIPDWRGFELDDPQDVQVAQALCRVHEPNGLAARLRPG